MMHLPHTVDSLAIIVYFPHTVTELCTPEVESSAGGVRGFLQLDKPPDRSNPAGINGIREIE